MKKHNGFTLVELVVVVMILGILAAVAAPKLLTTSSTATDNGIKQSLAIVRDAVERYAAENGGVLPGELETGADFKADIAKYLRGEFPTLPLFAKNADVAVTTTAGAITPAGTECWHYNSADGQFIVNNASATNSDPNVNYNEL